MQIATTGQTLTTALSSLAQKVENVRSMAGQTVTMSFYAKASTGTPNITAFAAQNFGSGGSTIVFTGSTKKAITTSWARYSFNINVPSVTGKTIGAGDHIRFDVCVSAGSDRNAYTDSIGIQTGTFQIWGIQVEYGSKATPFQTASGGSIQGELAMCQRYYWRSTSSAGSQTAIGAFAMTNATTTAEAYLRIPTTFRVTPTSVDFSNIGIQTTSTGLTAISAVTIMTASTNDCAQLQVTSTGLTANQFGIIRGSSGTGYIGLSAEL